MAGAAFERDEMVKLLKASSIPEAAIDDFERCHVGTITRFSSFQLRCREARDGAADGSDADRVDVGPEDGQHVGRR